MTQRKHWLAVGTVVFAIIAGSFIYNYYLVDVSDMIVKSPEANFEFNYLQANNTVIVRHVEGDDFRKPKTRTVEVYVFPANETIPLSPTKTVKFPFTEGESVTVENVEENEKAVVVWRGRDASKKLAEYSV